MPELKSSTEISASVWKVVLWRALTAAAFAALTIFWQEPAATFVAYAMAVVMLLSAKFTWDYARNDTAPTYLKAPVALECVAWLIAAVVIVLIPQPLVMAIAAAAAFGLAGVLDLVLWLRHRRDYLPLKDQLTTGLVQLGTGIALLFVLDMDAHAVGGVVGGGMVITGVFLLIAAAGYRHDAKSAADAS